MDDKVLTEEKIWAMFAETNAVLKDLAQTVKNTDAQIAKTERQMEKTERQMEETKKQMAETEKQMAENDRKFALMRKEVAGIGDSNGLVAEDVVYESLLYDKLFGGIKFDRITRRMAGGIDLPNGESVNGEYDVVLFNGTSIAVVEAKYRVRKHDVEQLINVQLPKFKLIFPEYAKYKIYLGIGGMSFDSGVEEEAQQKGIGTLKLGGEAVEINDKNVKAW